VGGAGNAFEMACDCREARKNIYIGTMDESGQPVPRQHGLPKRTRVKAKPKKKKVAMKKVLPKKTKAKKQVKIEAKAKNTKAKQPVKTKEKPCGFSPEKS
jgi:hypothetical protein